VATPRLKFLLGAAAVLIGSLAHAQTVSIPGLFASGVDGTGALLGDAANDAHYVVTASTAGSNYVGTSYTVSTSHLDGAWAANTASARWIVSPRPGSPDGRANRPDGTFDYTITFTMPVGAQLGTVSISGTGAAGDSGTIYVNGVLVSGESLAGGGSTNSFTLNATNSTFAAGSNTITFRVTNSSNNSSTGLLITGLSGTAVVPEVGAFLPVLGAMFLFAGLKVWRWRTSLG
jgi:hypothetical protein